MIATEVIRRLLRRYPVRWVAEPLIRLVENLLIVRVAHYRVDCDTSGSIKFIQRGKSYEIRRAGKDFSAMAISRHERPTIGAILDSVSAGMTVWDIGANIGFYSCLLSRVVGPKGEVFAFEPIPRVFRRLEHQLTAARVTNVRAFPFALSNIDGDAQMLSNSNYTPISRIVSGEIEKGIGDEVVNVSTLRGDSLILKGLAHAPTFIKLDVEGHEFSVLSGMLKLLSAPTLRAILCELHFSLLEQTGVTSQEIRHLLVKCGLVHQQWISRSHLLARR
jgi:FkbM family methyltransferase